MVLLRRVGFMEDVPSDDAGSAIVIEVESPTAVHSVTPSVPWTKSNVKRPRTTRRKRKPITPPQPSCLTRRCNNCGVTKTPQWREGPDGPKTLCNACGVKYSRERQDKTKSRKSRKLKPKTGIKSSSKLGYSSVTATRKRTRHPLSTPPTAGSVAAVRDRQGYDLAFLFSTTASPSPVPKMARVSSSCPSEVTGKEYAAALSLVSLAILGSPSSVDRCSRGYVMESEPPKTRRSKRIARRPYAAVPYYGGLDADEWIPHFLDDDAGDDVWKSDVVAMGVPCVWAAMGYQDPCCHHCPKHGSASSLKKLSESDVASTASDSAKSDFLFHSKI